VVHDAQKIFSNFPGLTGAYGTLRGGIGVKKNKGHNNGTTGVAISQCGLDTATMFDGKDCIPWDS